MKLRHWSDAPVESVRSTPQAPDDELGIYRKPQGFWVSDEDDEEGSWSAWCGGENYQCGALEHAVTLAADAQILYLRNADELLAFTTEYGAPWSVTGHYFGKAINWPCLADRYQGIIITPYVWKMRMHPETDWYYIWDCASGCIWDAAAIASVELVPQETEAVHG